MRAIANSAFFSIMICMSACAERDIEPSVRDATLPFALTDLDGNPVSSEDAAFDGKVVLIDIWGTWCPPCRESIPYLEKMHEDYAGEGLAIVGIAFEEEEDTEKRREALKAFVADHEIEYLVLDGGSTAALNKSLPTLEGFRGFPTMIIVGRDGAVAHANTVFVPRELGKIRKEVEKALKAVTEEETSKDG